MLSQEDKITIKLIRQEKGWGAKRLLKQFPEKQWSVTSLKRLIRKIDNTGSVKRTPGSGRPRAVQFLESNVPSFIEPALWPPNSPDLNPVDYAVWGALQQMVYRDRVNSLQDLIEKITRCWDELSQ